MFGSSGMFTNLNLARFDDNLDKDAILADDSFIWSTERIDQLIDDIVCTRINPKKIKNNPFFEHNQSLRKPSVSFQYTKREQEEIQKCILDPVYFTEKYVMFNQDDVGFQNVKLRDYQYPMLETYHRENRVIVMASRQCGKTVVSSAYIVWFILFNKEKTVLVFGNDSKSAKENVDKIQGIITHLPFWLKPGIVSWNESGMEFENGCRILSGAVTKTARAGMAADLVYFDEFALIDPTILPNFYATVMPTLSSRKNAKVIITSTPRGQNVFYDLWQMAINKAEGAYTPIRVDWWQIAGRDEAWKRRTIAELAGDEERFNREYGLQFFSSDMKLLDGSDIQKLNRVCHPYVSKKFKVLEIPKFIVDGANSRLKEEDYSRYLTWSPHFLEKHMAIDLITTLKGDYSKYVLAIDTAKGVGQDYSVINIFKIGAYKKDLLMKNRFTIKHESDIFTLVQVGVFRCNTVNIDDFSKVINAIVYHIFNPDNVSIILELNHQGAVIRDRLSKHINYDPSMIIKTKRTDKSLYADEYGLSMNSNKKKTELVENFKTLLQRDRINITDKDTAKELIDFGVSVSRGMSVIYRAQSGHDDLAMSSVFTSVMFADYCYPFRMICEDLFSKIIDQGYLDVVRKAIAENTAENMSGGYGGYHGGAEIEDSSVKRYLECRVNNYIEE